MNEKGRTIEYCGSRAVIGSALLEQTGELLMRLEPAVKRAIIVSDENCFPLYGERLSASLAGAGIAASSCVLAPGERAKTLASVECIAKSAANAGLDRQDVFIGLGGGVVCDIAGFCASSYMRGARLALVPTSLLSQNDAAIGGKNGVNLPQGKNLLGSFLMPVFTLCDIDLLATLPKAQLKNGMAEIVKHALIASPELMDILETVSEEELCSPGLLCEITGLSAAVKTDIVTRDFREKGERELLNFGHTTAHALERLSNGAIEHGSAVAVGIACAMRYAALDGLCDMKYCERVLALLERLGLPTSHGFEPEKLCAAMQSDKKSHGYNIDIILSDAVGNCFRHSVPASGLRGLAAAGKSGVCAVCSAKSFDGDYTAPVSKSEAQRALLMAAVSHGSSRIELSGVLCDDILRCCSAVRALGAQLELSGETAIISPAEKLPEHCEIDCGGSATLLRLLIPLCAALGMSARLTVNAQLEKRPLGEYLRLLPEHGADLKADSGTVTVSERLKAGHYALSGRQSSQFFSGMLLAACFMDGESIIESDSAGAFPYIALTASMLGRFGAEVRLEGGSATVRGTGLHGAEFPVGGDWSAAAFAAAMGALGGRVTVTGLDMSSSQPDRRIINILQQMNAGVEESEHGFTVHKTELTPLEVSLEQSPDLAPVCAVLCCGARGVSRLDGLAALRYKESDRLSALCFSLGALGADVRIENDSLVISGSGLLRGGTACGCGDHRVIMSLAAAACLCKESVVITQADGVGKSCPLFFEKYCEIGGNANVVELR